MATTTQTKPTATQATPRRTLPLITKSEFAAAYSKAGRILVSLENRKVYDVTDFVDSHPGGAELIVDYAGKDVSEIMADVDSHDHSDSAYEMLEDDHLRAFLATDEEEKHLLEQGSDKDIYRVDGHGDAEEKLTVQTDFEQDYKKNHFLDLNKPLLLQVLFGGFSKDFYLEQVHKPRHYGKGSAPIFGNFLEPISKTPWFVVPILWIPVDMYVFSLGVRNLPMPWVVGPLMYGIGLFIWTFLEYCMHRFLFHLDDHLPDHPFFLMLHFLLHGVHHYLPMDRLRLVMPPALLTVLAFPFWKLVHFLLPEPFAKAGFAGGFMGYILYDVTHYSLHHVRLPEYLKTLKKYHLDHHYKNYELGFGVTSKFWDTVFGTELVDTSAKSKGL